MQTRGGRGRAVTARKSGWYAVHLGNQRLAPERVWPAPGRDKWLRRLIEPHQRLGNIVIPKGPVMLAWAFDVGVIDAEVF